MALNKKDLETIETMLTNVVKAEITPLQKELNDLKKSVNALSKDNAKVESSKATKTTTSKSKKLSPVGVTKVDKDSVIKFVTNKAKRTITWKTWIDHDTQFKPMDTVAQKYKATRKGKTYSFSSRENALAFYEELTKLFPKAQFERA